jgi:sortase A
MDRTPALVWTRRLLWGAAVVCLGAWLWYQLDGAVYRAVEGRRLERALAARPGEAVAGGPPAEPGPGRPGRGGDAGATAGATLPPEEPPAAAPGDASQAEAEPAVAAGTRVLGRLEIPRLDLSVVVAEGIDRRTLRRAAGHVPGTAAPGGPGNAAIAGHRDGVFRPLEGAARDDLVVFETPAGRFRYRVKSVAVVPPGATHLLAPTAEPTLTLITCYPFTFLGPAPDRFVVRAERLGPG